MKGPVASKAATILIDRLLGPTNYSSSFDKNPSIHFRLKGLVSKPDHYLDPSPLINSALGELVSYLQGAPNLDLGDDTRPFSSIADEVCRLIDSDRLLQHRASTIRTIATRAESRLELFYVRRLLKSTFRPETESAAQKVILASEDFPYTENYVFMVEKEAQVIECFLDTLRNRQDSPADGELSIAFCGSGPLPLTGILLSAYMNVNVTLVDNDSEAVQYSERLIEKWENDGVIPAGRIKIVLSDCADVHFVRPGSKNENGQIAVKCDVVFVAALIPNATKECVLERVSSLKEEGPVVVLRSAHGLTARLAYFRSRRKTMSRYLNFIGTVVPCVHDFGNGFVVDDDVQPMEFFSSEILNSLELYSWRRPNNVVERL